MQLPIKDLVIGAVAGYVLKTVWASLGVGGGFYIQPLRINVDGAWAVAFVVAGYGAFKNRRLLWIGLAMMAGIWVKDATSPAP